MILQDCRIIHRTLSPNTSKYQPSHQFCYRPSLGSVRSVQDMSEVAPKEIVAAALLHDSQARQHGLPLLETCGKGRAFPGARCARGELLRLSKETGDRYRWIRIGLGQCIPRWNDMNLYLHTWPSGKQRAKSTLPCS